MDKLIDIGRLQHLAAILLLCVTHVCAADSAVLAGHVDKILGTATIRTFENSVIHLKAGMSVNEGAIIRTAPGSQLHLRYVDESTMVMGPSSTLKVERDRQDSKVGKLLLILRTGVFRILSGKFSGADKVEVKTVVATIGIRGTHFGVECDEVSATVVLLPQSKEGPNAIDVYNSFGRVSIDEPGYGTNIPDASSPPSPPRRMRLQMIESLSRRAIHPPGLR